MAKTVCLQFLFPSSCDIIIFQKISEMDELRLVVFIEPQCKNTAHIT